MAAERLVAQRYIRSGFTLEKSNYRVPGVGEIDLIFSARRKLYFVECKSSATHDAAARHLSERQQGRMHKTALHYLQKHNLKQSMEMRFDAALVDQMGVVQVHPGALN